MTVYTGAQAGTVTYGTSAVNQFRYPDLSQTTIWTENDGPFNSTFGDPLIPQPGEDYDALTARAEAAVRALGGEKGIAVDTPVAAGAGSAEGPNYWY